MDTLLLASILLLLGLGLILGEILLAASGLASFMAATCILGAIAVAFAYHGPLTGSLFIGLSVVGVPLALGGAVWILPYTPLGQHILAANPTEEEVLPADGVLATVRKLVGKTGVAETVMLPGGVVVIDGKSFEAVSQGEVIEPGQTIKVVDVQTHRLVVRRANKSLEETEHRARALDDPLGKSIEELGIDPYADPLG